jgi:hypothetical protein
MDKLDRMDHLKKRSLRTSGNVMYIGQLIRKRFLPFMIFYFAVNTLLSDYLKKFR